MMENITSLAIQCAQKCEHVYTKFIKPNDVGKTSHELTRSHQAGFYISKSFLPAVFESDIEKSQDYEIYVTIKWQNDFETDSRFKYYGSKNECHLTRMGNNFPFRFDDNIGDLLVLCKESKNYYRAFVLQTEEDIENFLAALNITIGDAGKAILKQKPIDEKGNLFLCFSAFLRQLNKEFPSTLEMSSNARQCYNKAYSITQKNIVTNPDKNLLNWIEAEYQLFKVIENDRYAERIKTPFPTVEELIKVANTILQRRKSRAGSSLEHHLEAIFLACELAFETQVKTEDKKTPDFLFPGAAAYRNLAYDSNKLISLASKTTCKDRWRQILNEADRIKTKHLFTLQQGISRNQLTEMYNSGVCLVIPKYNLGTYPDEFKHRILTLERFIQLVKTN